jgi:TolA-binding protein
MVRFRLIRLPLVIGVLAYLVAGAGTEVSLAQGQPLQGLPAQGPSRESSDRFAVAAEHYGQQRWKQAADEFRGFIEKFPDEPLVVDALFYEAEALMQLQEFAAAQQRFTELLERNPPETTVRRVLYRLGETLFLTGEKAAAKERLEEFHSRFPDDAMIAYAVPYLAEIARESGDDAKARELYASSLNAHPNGPRADDCRLGLARSLAAAGESDEALRFYDYLIERRGPLADDAQFGKGEALRLARDAGAAAVYEKLSNDWPQSEWLDDGLHAQVQLALAARDHAAVDRLAGEFSRRYSDSPLAASVLRLRGKSLLMRGDFAAASSVFESLDKSEREALDAAGDAYYLSVAWLGQEKYEQALAAVDQIELDGLPPNVAGELLSARGAAHAGLKDFPAAAADLERSLSLHPDSSDGDRRRAQLAVSLTSCGELDKAEQVLSEMATKAKDRGLFSAAARHFAETALADNQNERAQKWFAMIVDQGGESTPAASDGTDASEEPAAEATTEEPPPAGDEVSALSGLAWSQFRAGDYKTAAESFGRLADDNPAHALAAEAMLMRGKSLEKLSQSAAALEAFQAVIERYSDSPEKPEAMLSGAMLIAAGAGAASEADAQDAKRHAADLLAQVAEQFPDFDRLDAALYERAWLLDELGETAASTDAFARLHADHRASEYWADATYRLAERAARAKDYPRAKEALGQLLQSPSEDEIQAHALFLEAQVSAAEERWADVAAPLERLLETWPDHSLALSAEYWIAESLFHAQDYEQAAARFAALSERVAGRDDAWLPMVPLRRAQMLARERKWSEAYDLAATIEKDYPEFRQLYEVDYLLGRCLGKRGDFSAAREAYERVVLSPEGGRTETAAMAQWMIGESFFHQKKYDEAIRAYTQVVSLFAWPRWQAGALLQAGKCYELKGEVAEAEKNYARLIKDFPDTPFTEEAAARLKKESKAGGRKTAAPRSRKPPVAQAATSRE